tara:strand:+ start:233 stop:616 length:384 start_codon:yes stop_codon:yes gene_type:complete
MRFKMASRNPFRDFVRNLRRISISDYTIEEKHNLFYELWDNLSPKLSETELYLNSSPAYSSRCEHWNYRDLDVQSIVPVSNLKNPYLRLKREFETAMANESNERFVTAVSKSLMWFYVQPYRDDWVT